MTNLETANYLRRWVKHEAGSHFPFAWPTDGCGYEQHVKFVGYRNTNWTEDRKSGQTFDEFVL